MIFRSIKSLRRLAIPVLAVYAMLHVGVAFAGCLPFAMKMAQKPAAPCCDVSYANIAIWNAEADAVSSLCENHCVVASAPQQSGSEASALAFEIPSWRPPRIADSYATPHRTLPPLTGPYAYGHPLIYRLQRLLT